MPAKQNFEGLIKAGWDVIDRNFDEVAFLEWRETAVEYLTDTLGPDHYYTKYFSNKVLQAEAVGVLSGTGLLSAAREQRINHHAKCAALSVCEFSSMREGVI